MRQEKYHICDQVLLEVLWTFKYPLRSDAPELDREGQLHAASRTMKSISKGTNITVFPRLSMFTTNDRYFDRTVGQL